MKKKGGNLKRVKRQNMSLIKEMIYKNRRITRTEIADRLSLTLPTVTTAVNQLLEEGILTESPVPDRTGELGRRPVALDFNHDQMYFVGVELKPFDTAICIMDLTGTVITQEKYTVAPDNYSEMKQVLSQQIEETIRKSGVDRRAVQGIGIGLPGLVQYESGFIYRNIHPDWQEQHLAGDIMELIGIRTVIENNVRVRAVATELRGGIEKSSDIPENFAYFFVSAGIACSLVIKDAVYTGYQAGAGELGHTVIIPDGPICKVCGNRGCLDAVAGERVILEEYQKILLQRTGRKEPDVTIKEVIRDFRNHERQTRELLYLRVKYLAIALANIINYVSPQTVYVDGYIFQEEELRQCILEAVRFHLYGKEHCEILFVPYDSFGGAKAAAFFAVKHIFIQ